jgi:hypothetical protein
VLAKRLAEPLYRLLSPRLYPYIEITHSGEIPLMFRQANEGVFYVLLSQQEKQSIRIVNRIDLPVQDQLSQLRPMGCPHLKVRMTSGEKCFKMWLLFYRRIAEDL